MLRLSKNTLFVRKATTNLLLCPTTILLAQKRLNHSGRNERKSTSVQKPNFTDSTIAAGHSVIDALSSRNVADRLNRSCLSEFTNDEVKLRVELAAAYRLFAHLSWVEAIYNHLTVELRNEDGSKSYLINPMGLRFDEITASSLLKIDAEGNVLHPGVIGDILKVNRAGWIIHGGIHLARGNTAASVMHCHHPAFTGIAATQQGLLSDISQTSETLGDVATHDFEGIVVDETERARMVEDLGACDTLLLRNHGVITMGNSIGAAWYRMYVAIRAAEIQVAAQSAAAAGGGLLRPDAKTLGKTREALEYFQTADDYGTLEFAAYMRLMDSIDASYRL